MRRTMEPPRAVEIASCSSKLGRRGFGLDRDARLSGRVSARLLEAAKRRAHVTSDTELIELALSRMALEDDFGPRLCFDERDACPRTSILNFDLQIAES